MYKFIQDETMEGKVIHLAIQKTTLGDEVYGSYRPDLKAAIDYRDALSLQCSPDEFECSSLEEFKQAFQEKNL